MDIVELLENAIQALPAGDYSTGLNAIVRHVKAAIRHLERDRQEDPDTCTDAIYRTNQAYEGSLKEAYRVLAGKDPSGLSPFQIEGYLESHNVVRPRVLTQLARYRQDYRNPSTHDYKLDFDDDEALLAIVSVCAFAKLLTNQIHSKLASETAQARAIARSPKSSRASLRSLGKNIATICLEYTNESSDVQWFEYERGLAASLETSGFSTEVLIREEETSSISIWDVVVKKGKSEFGIDVRMSHHTRPTADLVNVGYVHSWLVSKQVSGALIVLRSRGRSGYHLYKGEASGKPVYIISEHDDGQLAEIRKDLGELQQLR